MVYKVTSGTVKIKCIPSARICRECHVAQNHSPRFHVSFSLHDVLKEKMEQGKGKIRCRVWYNTEYKLDTVYVYCEGISPKSSELKLTLTKVTFLFLYSTHPPM